MDFRSILFLDQRLTESAVQKGIAQYDKNRDHADQSELHRCEEPGENDHDDELNDFRTDLLDAAPESALDGPFFQAHDGSVLLCIPETGSLRRLFFRLDGSLGAM